MQNEWKLIRSFDTDIRPHLRHLPCRGGIAVRELGTQKWSCLYCLEPAPEHLNQLLVALRSMKRKFKV